MHLDLRHERYLVMRCDRCGLDFAIAFDDAEDSHIVVGGGLHTIPLRSWGPHKTHFCSILTLPIVYTGSSLRRARPTNCSYAVHYRRLPIGALSEEHRCPPILEVDTYDRQRLRVKSSSA